MYLLSQVPGGKVDKGENGLQAAHRETYEETGLNLALRRFKHINRDSRYECEVYAIKLQGHEEPRLTEPENMTDWIYHPWQTFKIIAQHGRLTPSLELYYEEIREHFK